MTRSTEPDASQGRIPDFFIVGHPKSGTTALYEMLRSHPQIFMPDLKEPRFFASDLRSRFQGRLPDGAPRAALPETLEEYLALFAAAAPGQRVGESSPSYLRSAMAARLIAEAQPGARIIAILREPASFMRSLHLELVQNHVEREQDLRRALANDELAGEGSPSQLPRYSDRVSYVEQLRRYHAVFPAEQVQVLIYDDFRADNSGTVRRVERFLGVAERGAPVPAEANPSVRRRVGLDNALHEAFFGGGGAMRTARRAARLVTPEPARRRAFRTLREKLVFAGPGEDDEELMLELRRRYRGEVEALSKYLDRDLVREWGYAELG